MSIIRHLIIAVSLSVMAIAPAAQAQESAAPAQARQSSSTVVTASATAEGVRFASPEEGVRMRVEIFSGEGERVLDTDFRQGNIVDVKTAEVPQLLSGAQYLCVVTFQDLRGRTGQRLATVSAEGGQLSLRGARASKLSGAQAQSLKQTDDEGAVAVLNGGGTAATVTAHDGGDGQVTSTSGALTLRTGDVFSGQDKEHVRITPEGQVGIGTDKPEATLDVAGTIRARGGIQFEDGSVINSAADLGAKKSSSSSKTTAAATDSTNTAAVAGTGTTGNILKWTDGVSGTAGDSAMVETGGKIGIGTNAPQYPFHLNNPTFAQLFVSGGTAADFLMFHQNAPLNTRWTGLRSQNGLGKISSFNDNASYRQENILTWNNATGNVGVGVASPQYPLHIANPNFAQLFVAGGQAADFLMFHINAPVNARWTGLRSQGGFGKISSFNDNGSYKVENILNWSNTNGNVAVGAAPGAEKFEVTGNLKVNGAGNGIIFSDGTKLTTAAGSNAVQFVPAAEQLSVGDANGTAPMINLRGGSTCCSGPGGHTPAFFKVFQNGSFVATGNLGIGTSPMEGKGYRTSWHTYKGAFRSGYADNEWDDANVGFFSWAGGSNSTASGLYALAFGDTNSAESTSSIVFGSGNQVKGAAGFSAGAGNRVCDTYGVALGNNAKSGGPYINGRCDPETFNIRGLAAVAIGYNVTADQDHTTAMGKFASNNGFQGTFIWSDGAAQASADTFRNTANNEFAARATGGFRFRTNLGGTTGCNLPAGSGVFNCTSSRTTKENFLQVKGEDLLTSMRKVPVTTWNYINEGRQVRHIGPMAEDFHAAFGLGTDNKSIGVQDMGGLNFAAIKALEARTAELQQKTEEVEQLRSRLATLEQRLAAIEEGLKAKEQK